jgi:LPPG:FO 2-phospho-L-lactate transferase
MLQIKGIRKELSKIKRKVIAVSPLIGDKAITGPAAKYMEAAGIETNAYGLAKMYSDVCSNIVVDTKDKALIKKIQDLAMNGYETKITMKNKIAEDALASFILKQIHV